MQLLLKDKPILDIQDNGICRILDFDRLPFALRKENVTFVDFIEWASNRTLSIGRSYAKEILNSLRLSQTNRFAVCKACRGLSAFEDFVGPLGCPSELVNEDIEDLKKEKLLFVAGGVGTAPVYPQVKWLHEQGIEADVIVGAKTKDLIILEKEMEAVAGNLYITTDDGSYGRSGMVTKVIDDLMAEGKTYTKCISIGPMIMMKFCCLTTQKYNIPTIVSMNPIMVDGTGMCGACRVIVGGEVKFACVDGPEFDGHKIDWDLAMKRQQMYKTEEGRALLKEREGDTHHGGCGNCGGDE